MRQIDDSIRIYAESGWEIPSLCSWRVLGIVSSINPLLAALVSVSPFHLHAKRCLASCDMYCPFGVICPCVGFVERSVSWIGFPLHVVICRDVALQGSDVIDDKSIDNSWQLIHVSCQACLLYLS